MQPGLLETNPNRIFVIGHRPQCLLLFEGSGAIYWQGWFVYLNRERLIH